MAIDINELRRLTQAALAGPDGISLNWIKLLQDFQQKASPSAISELLDRLEDAESDALEQARLNGMGSEREAALMAKLEEAEKERDALRAKIEAMERQAPAGYGVRYVEPTNGEEDWDSIWKYRVFAEDHIKDFTQAYADVGEPVGASTVVPLYALPGAQPQLNEIKIALQRALELGRREAWTGVRKHRSWEDQREEQQCWNKVWSLLGAKGE